MLRVCGDGFTVPPLDLWIASAPAESGIVGTGPVDRSLATQVLYGPAGFDMPGGAGELLDGAYRWCKRSTGSA